MPSKWKYGCGMIIAVHIPRGYDTVEVFLECGSTAFDGGINQCEACEEKFPTPGAAYEDETDEEFDARIHRNLLDEF